MKKRFLIGTTVLAMMLTFGLLAYSVFAALNQGFLVKNTISFAGSQNIKFAIAGAITGTNNQENPNLTHNWSYDYETSNVNQDSWQVGDIVFDSEGKDIEDIHITYTFVITNSCEVQITASINGPEGIVAPLIKKTFVKNGNATPQTGTMVTIGPEEQGTIILQLTLSEMQDVSVNQNVDFTIEVVANT